MRHNIAGRKLGLPTAERMSLLANLTTSLFKHEHVETTIARGKEMRRRAEKAITCAKKGLQPGREIFYRQLAGKYVHDHEVTIPILFGALAPRYRDRPGGYTRLTKTGFNPKDKSDLCIVELVDSGIDTVALQNKLRKEAKKAVIPTLPSIRTPGYRDGVAPAKIAK